MPKETLLLILLFVSFFFRSPSPPPNDERYTHKNGRRHNISSSARSDTSNRGRTRHDRGRIYHSHN